MSERIAEFVMSLPQDFPDVAQQLFHLVPPYEGTEFVIASSALPWMNPKPEVVLFEAREVEPGIYETGHSITEVRWTLDSREAFERIEYEVVGGEPLPELRPITGPELGVTQEYVDEVRERSVDPMKYLRKYLDAHVVDEYVKQMYDPDQLTEEQHNEIRDWGGGS